LNLTQNLLMDSVTQTWLIGPGSATVVDTCSFTLYSITAVGLRSDSSYYTSVIIQLNDLISAIDLNRTADSSNCVTQLLCQIQFRQYKAAIFLNLTLNLLMNFRSPRSTQSSKKEINVTPNLLKWGEYNPVNILNLTLNLYKTGPQMLLWTNMH
jgi:hypothetical protein